MALVISGRLADLYVLRMRTEVRDGAGVVVVVEVIGVVVVVNNVVVSGHSYSGQGHPFGHSS